MPRIVRLESTEPYKIEPGAVPPDKAIWICTCGLSQTMPFCDKSHKLARTETPGTLCIYSKDGKRVLSSRPDDHPADAR